VLSKQEALAGGSRRRIYRQGHRANLSTPIPAFGAVGRAVAGSLRSRASGSPPYEWFVLARDAGKFATRAEGRDIADPGGYVSEAQFWAPQQRLLARGGRRTSSR